MEEQTYRKVPTSALYGGEWVVSRPGHFYKGGKLLVPTEKEAGWEPICNFGEGINLPRY
jgi:hypothetical protein